MNHRDLRGKGESEKETSSLASVSFAAFYFTMKSFISIGTREVNRILETKFPIPNPCKY